MPETEQPKPGDWVRVGRKRAVVCAVYDADHLEVVYLDDRDRAINEDVRRSGGGWEFAVSGPCGGYADKYDRLREYVGILRRGMKVL